MRKLMKVIILILFLNSIVLMGYNEVIRNALLRGKIVGDEDAFVNVDSIAVTHFVTDGNIVTTGTLDLTITNNTATGEKGINLNIAEDTIDLTGTLDAIYARATGFGADNSHGRVQGAEIGARLPHGDGTKAVGEVVAVYGWADTKIGDVGTLRVFEASLDGGAGGTATSAVAFEAFNNTSAAYTTSIAYDVNEGACVVRAPYTYDMRMQRGLTIDNATDNALEINENSDELILTFGSNTITASSGDVTTFTFGTINVGGAAWTGTGKIATTLITEQLRLSYDASNYATWTVAADGALTLVTVDNVAAEGDINFNPDGLVGIKTAVPTVELDVTGAGKFSGDLTVSGTTTLDSVVSIGGWGYTGEHIIIPEASSNTNAGLGLYGMVNDTITAGKVIAGTYSRMLAMTADQPNQSTMVGAETQFRLYDVDIADGVHAGLWAYAEQSGTSVLSGEGTFDAISATVESGADFTVGATEHVTGITLDGSINGSASIDGSANYSAVYIKSNGKDWFNGIKITGVDNDIMLQNEETICNDVDGVIKINGALNFAAAGGTYAASVGLLGGAGASGTSNAYDLGATAGTTKGLSFYLKSTSTLATDAIEGLYITTYHGVNGTSAAPSGEAARFRAYLVGDQAGTIALTGMHSSVEVGSGGSGAGLVVGGRSNMIFPDETVSFGTASGLQAELFSYGASAAFSGASPSILRLVIDGTITASNWGEVPVFDISVPAALVSTNGYLVDTDAGGDACDAKMRIRVNGVAYWVMLATANN